MQRSEIVKMVLTKMDEVSPQGNLDELTSVPVDSVLDEAAREMLLVLPPSSSRVSVSHTSNPTTSTNGTGSIPLPEGFIKLTRFKMKEWHRPVTSAIREDDPAYAHQHNSVIRGGIAKPVAAIVSNEKGFSLEYYSVKTSHEVEYLFYVPFIKPEEIPLRLINALAWKAAELVLQLMGDTERMQLCAQRFINTCNTL